MAKQHEYYIKYDSNGAAVIGQLTISAKKLSEAVSAAQTNIKKSFSSITRTFAASSIALNNGVRGLEQLAEPAMEFDEAMRTANTMAGKGAEGFEKLKDQIKELSKEVPIARDVLANGLYQAISNGVPEDNWMSFLEQSDRSSVGGIADLGEVVKVTSTVIKIAIFVSRNSTNILQKSTDSMATFKAEVYAHQKRADGTYNVKIRITHNQRKKYLATQWYVSKDDLTRSLKIKN